MAAVNVGNKSNKTASKSPEYAPDKMSAEETFTLPCMCQQETCLMLEMCCK
jgi:hypothetical protein